METQYLIDGGFYYFVWGDTTSTQLINLVETNRKPKYVAVVGPEEFEAPQFFSSIEQYKFFKGYCQYHNIRLFHITSAVMDPKYNSRYYASNQKDTISWSSFFAAQVVASQLDRDITPFGHSETILKHFISLNGRSHPWRCRFIDYMSKYDLIDKGYVSWHNSDNWDYNYEFRWWTPEIINFDERWIKNTDGILDILYPPEEFKTSLFSVISESNPNCLFVTEKTFLPIFHKRPFIIYGAPNFQRYVESQGFQLFDEVIDYSFDTVEDDEVRCDMMMQQVKQLCEYDIYELKSLLQEKVEYNFKHMMKIVADKSRIHPTIIKILDKNHEQLEHYRFLLNIGNSEYFKHYLKKHDIDI